MNKNIKRLAGLFLFIIAIVISLYIQFKDFGKMTKLNINRFSNNWQLYIIGLILCIIGMFLITDNKE